MRTQKEINEQINRLKAIRPKIRPTSFFGDSNLDKLDAQVKVLEEDLDTYNISDEWPDEGDTEIRAGADEARDWLDGESDIEDLAEDWPLEE